MTKRKTIFLWIFFLFLIPCSYLLIRFIIFPKFSEINSILTLLLYVFSIITFMYRIDNRFYFLLMKWKQWFSGSHTSWVFSVRYQNILNYENVLDGLFKELSKNDGNLNRKEKDFLSVFWQRKYLFSFRIELGKQNEYSLHFCTSIIDVSFRTMKQKIKEFNKVFEIIENNFNMENRNDKRYDIEIIYPNGSPFYSFWIKALPSEKIISFKTKILDNMGIITVDNNKIRYSTQSLSDLFHKLQSYLNLRGD